MIGSHAAGAALFVAIGGAIGAYVVGDGRPPWVRGDSSNDSSIGDGGGDSGGE